MLTAEIIAVGTELLLGQTLNSNAKYLGEQCAALGVNVYFQTVVGDNHQRIMDVLNVAKNRAQLIICTGGLGPTQDDLTKDALAAFTHRKLEINAPALEHIQRFFAARGITMVKSNERQAHNITGAQPFPNEAGLAIGLALTDQDSADNRTHYIVLPGPPYELQPMFERYAVPWIQALTNDSSRLFSQTLRFSHIGESTLEDTLRDLIEQQTDVTIAPYAKVGEVAIRLTTRAASEQAAQQKIAPIVQQIRNRTQPYLYADEDISLEIAVFRLLQTQGATLAVAESCTGGLLSQLITSIAGSSTVFAGGLICYTNAIKHQYAGIPMDQLEGTQTDGKRAPGAVSAETAMQLASYIRTAMHTDYGLSITGVAGPSESEGKPVGLIFIGVSSAVATQSFQIQLVGQRNAIQLRAAKHALYLLYCALRAPQTP